MVQVRAFSQSSLLLLAPSQLCTSRQGQFPIGRSQASLAITKSMSSLTTRLATFRTTCTEQKQLFWGTRVGVVSDSKMPTTFTVDSAGEGIDVLPDSGGSNDNFGGVSGNGGSGGGGNGGNDDNSKGGSNGSEDQSGGNKEGMSMSQKLTLGYAALVGIGGIMGYLKGGSQKSLIAGGLSASVLYCVYTMLPSNPVLASALGLGLSASLLGVMGSRFKKSGKIFPAGVVSFASLVMTGGYLHGILRSLH
ncbi:protein FATTY ACID EXPORT 2, chloroplastic-like [Sesamum indicum]|uniref:Protein FATTY ACID EXPORT 2, chloroplastic-like n=1 Tax=Sesamum indicum TaxID=4182 RepID=A0A6I9UDT8_SESIN|nr:protein FATTY ACID EXPORT 2, chloroplastic-like [Sesamum indicum]